MRTRPQALPRTPVTIIQTGPHGAKARIVGYAGGRIGSLLAGVSV